MPLLLNVLWFIWEIKFILFWLYLWQLKDYHVGRFVDHFRTHTGKRLLLAPGQIIKAFLFILFLVSGIFLPYIFFVLFLLYLVQDLSFIVGIFKNRIKRPVTTVKALFLTAVSFSVVIIFWLQTLRLINIGDSLQQPALLLFFDILTPVVISVVVLFFQPFFVFLRNITLLRAKIKMEKLKEVSGIKVVAITGSYGKTSTKEFLSAILSKKFKVLKTSEHQNSEIGVAKCILNELKPSHQIFIAEVGAYNKGKVKEVCSILKPKIGIVTGVNEQHMALFGSLNNLLSAEGGGELADALPNNGTLVVNGDNKYCLNLYKKVNKNKKIYSLSNKAINSDIWADSITVHEKYISFLAIDKNGEAAHFDVKVLGKHNVQNLLGAILTAKMLGMNFGEISDACKNIFEKQGGMTLTQGKHGINVIDSSYSANPDGVFADLDYLSVFRGKRAVVMPCLIELGDKSAEIHEKIGRKIAEICDLAIITTKDKFDNIERGFNEAKRNGAKCLLCDKPQDIYSMITLFCKFGDAVLLEGRVPAGLINLLK